MNADILKIVSDYIYVLGIPICSASLLIKLGLSILIGKLIGRERKKNYKPGGGRTFGIICIGATLLPILSLELQKQGYQFDFVRLFAYGLVSLGFATSGIVRTYKDKVQGLTTASTIWVITIIGFLIGMGYYSMAIIATILTYAMLESKYKRIANKKRRKQNVKKRKSRVSG